MLLKTLRTQPSIATWPRFSNGIEHQALAPDCAIGIVDHEDAAHAEWAQALTPHDRSDPILTVKGWT